MGSVESNSLYFLEIDNKTTEFFYMSFQENIDIAEYTMEKIADSDCTPDDIYSWDAPFDSSETIQ